MAAGKSQIMRWAARACPSRAVLTTGRGSSGAGLTVTAVKDPVSQGWALEAGALVRAREIHPLLGAVWVGMFMLLIASFLLSLMSKSVDGYAANARRCLAQLLACVHPQR